MVFLAKDRSSPADPLGYYAALGVGPLADTAEIRAAFRRRVRELHPDSFPSEDDARNFIVATEAYQALRDRDYRRRYAQASHPSLPTEPPDPDDPPGEALTCWRCGKVTAQPRYIVFRRVAARLYAARTLSVAGVFCRRCADRTAVRASTASWIGGWWAPTGPWRTLSALMVNLAGGRRPRAENLRVLLHQARVFLAWGDSEVALSLAQQAQGIARGAEERALVRRYLDAAGRPRWRLTNIWRRRWGVALVQALPLVALAVAVSVGAAAAFFRSETAAVSAAIFVRPLRAGEIRHVATDTVKLRQGPGNEQAVVALLDRFTTLRVLAVPGDGEWARVATAAGAVGFVPARYLYPGPGDAPRQRWCEENRGPPLHNGDVLVRRTGGDRRIAVVNASGHDAVVLLKTAADGTLAAQYVAAGARTTLSDIPDGSFRVVYATGDDFSRACHVFLRDMRVFAVPAPAVLAPDETARPPLALPPPGDGPGQAKPLPVAGFLDG